MLFHISEETGITGFEPDHPTTLPIPGELLTRGVELRLMQDLWTLRDAVVTSTLQFSVIRMRNAAARTLPV